jgi:hypothetical protein
MIQLGFFKQPYLPPPDFQYTLFAHPAEYPGKGFRYCSEQAGELRLGDIDFNRSAPSDRLHR